MWARAEVDRRVTYFACAAPIAVVGTVWLWTFFWWTLLSRFAVNPWPLYWIGLVVTVGAVPVTAIWGRTIVARRAARLSLPFLLVIALCLWALFLPFFKVSYMRSSSSLVTGHWSLP